MKKNKKIALIAGAIIVVLAGMAVALTQKPAQKSNTDGQKQVDTIQDEKAPIIKLSDSDLQIAWAGDNTYPADNGSTSCFADVRNLTNNLDSSIRVYLMPEKCSNNITNIGWLAHNKVLFSFGEIKQATDTGDLHNFIKTKIADDKTEAIIFKINRSKTMLDGTPVSWVQPAAIIETSIDSGSTTQKVYFYLTDDSIQDQIDFNKFQSQIKALKITH